MDAIDASLLLWGLLNDSHGNHLSVVSLLLLLSGLDLSSLLLVSELLLSDLLLLHLVDGLNEHRLVLELVTFGGEIEVMVDILVDFLGLSILLQESSENSLSSHPLDLLWHSCLSGTLSFTSAIMSALSLCLMDSRHSGSGVHVDCSLHDKSILVELSDVFPY